MHFGGVGRVVGFECSAIFVYLVLLALLPRYGDVFDGFELMVSGEYVLALVGRETMLGDAWETLGLQYPCTYICLAFHLEGLHDLCSWQQKGSMYSDGTHIGKEIFMKQGQAIHVSRRRLRADATCPWLDSRTRKDFLRLHLPLPPRYSTNIA